MPEKLDVKSGASSPSRPIASMTRPLDSATKLLYRIGEVAVGVRTTGLHRFRNVFC